MRTNTCDTDCKKPIQTWEVAPWLRNVLGNQACCWHTVDYSHILLFLLF